VTDQPTILVTNDDGIHSGGLRAVVDALAPLGRVVVIAPDRNRSGVSRSITLGTTLEVTEHDVTNCQVAYATDGTPTDCVRMGVLGLAGPLPDIVVSGSNLGLNIGDDVAYSGTVSAAFDAAFNGLPAVAVSQQSLTGELGFMHAGEFDHRAMQLFLPRLVERMLARRMDLPTGLVVNVNVPGKAPEDICGVEVGSLGRRIYRDKLELASEEGGKRRFSLYGDDPTHHADETGTDIAAIGHGNIAVTPMRFQVADSQMALDMASWGLDLLLH
jgi:5'-nucleotidase